jgi:hypothetical protein
MFDWEDCANAEAESKMAIPKISGFIKMIYAAN